MISTPHVLMIFLDGVGLGAAGRPDNPLGSRRYASLERLALGQRWTAEATPSETPNHVFRGIDATLGVDGLPQSGTGQASLLTGVNCAQIVGRHFGPYPHSRTRPIIQEKNVFSQVLGLRSGRDQTVAFANAYPRRFFSHAATRDRWTVTTRCCLDAGVEIRSTDRLLLAEAVAADLTGESWPEPEIRLAPIDEREAATRLISLARCHSFTLFEYYLTDKAGHARDPVMAERILESLEKLFDGVLREINPTTDLLLITSDHGNLEDLSTKTHTRNAVPLVAFGVRAKTFANVRALTGVLPAIMDALR